MELPHLGAARAEVLTCESCAGGCASDSSAPVRCVLSQDPPGTVLWLGGDKMGPEKPSAAPCAKPQDAHLAVSCCLLPALSCCGILRFKSRFTVGVFLYSRAGCL